MNMLLALLLALVAPFAHAQANEQFVPANFYWVGPYAAGGSGIAGGMLDYLAILNARGVECYERTKRNGSTGATLVHPLSTGITYSLIDKGTGFPRGLGRRALHALDGAKWNILTDGMRPRPRTARW